MAKIDVAALAAAAAGTIWRHEPKARRREIVMTGILLSAHKRTSQIRRSFSAIFFGAVTLVPMSGPLGASECCDPKSPFREGEGRAETAATCENIAYWAARAPRTSARISMVIRGKLSAVKWTGVLAYLEMCDPKGLRVVCVTYETNGMKAGEIVSFAGGYERRSSQWVMLDPCLASRD